MNGLKPEAQKRRAIEAFRSEPRVLRLRGAVQRYAWGGMRFIPELIGVSNNREEPFAELWLGAHPRAPSMVELEDGWTALDRLIAEAPQAVLGLRGARRFGGRLPYLLKILDARRMLSIQVHPSPRQAREGFARENAAGIPLQDPRRSYSDDGPKPELQAALSEFWLLHGFRPLEQIAEVLASTPELAAIVPDFEKRLRRSRGRSGGGERLLRGLCERILSLPQPEVDSLLGPLLARLERKRGLAKNSPDYWVLHASRLFPLPGGHRDRGLLWIYLLNLVHLKPGQATFQPVGLPHAYLEGTSVEIMTSSDNVLRAGLTRKHVDAEELLKALNFESGLPRMLEARAVSDTERVYPAPVKEFRLSRIEVRPGRDHRCGAGHGPDCLIVLEGEAVLRAAERELSLPRGQAALAPAGLPYSVEARTDRAVLYRATTPV